MSVQIQFRLNPALYLRDPESSELGQNILRESIGLINEIGLEDFTFRKLALRVGTTEASIYRYFENKHRLLTYIVAWWWSWLDYRLHFALHNVNDPAAGIRTLLRVLVLDTEGDEDFPHIDKKSLYELVLRESNKAYLNRYVDESNKQQLYKPYKDLCARIAGVFLQYNKKYRHPRSLATTVLEMSHLLIFFKRHLPSLTDFPGAQGQKEALNFLEGMVMAALEAKGK